MKVIIFLTTFALLATLDFVSSTSLCPGDKSFGCASNERYEEYLISKYKLVNYSSKCPRDKKIKKLKAKNRIMIPMEDRDCYADVVIMISWVFCAYFGFKNSFIFFSTKSFLEDWTQRTSSTTMSYVSTAFQWTLDFTLPRTISSPKE